MFNQFANENSGQDKRSAAAQDFDRNYGEKLGYNDCAIDGYCSIDPIVYSLMEVLLYELKQITYYYIKMQELGYENKKFKNQIINYLSLFLIGYEFNRDEFERILKEIRVGVTEKELAAKLSLFMVQEGADTQPYGNILISGSRTSLLHGIPSQKAIEYGDLVLMDYGCQYHGYLSDMTRTVVVGRATEKQREVYALEQQMVADVEAFLKDGVSARDAYEVSTKAIRDTSYFPYHYTGIGHGVGMFVHELPFMSPRSNDIIHAGNVMTVEPGIYIPGWGGIRIEDQILITETGHKNLISATKDLIEL